MALTRVSAHDQSEAMVTVPSSETNDQQGDPADPVVSTLMTNRIVAVLPSTTLIEALRVMDAAGMCHLPVVEGTRCVGLLAEPTCCTS